MWRFRRKDDTKNGGTAVADFPPGYDGTTAELWDEIEQLTSGERDRDAERRVLRLRHIAGIRAMEEAQGGAEFPAEAALPAADGLPEFSRDAVTPELLRGGILRDGCVLVRGLIDRDRALAFAARIDRAFSERESGDPAAGYYEEFVPNFPYKGVVGRGWIKDGGGVLAADSPTVAFEMFDLFREANLAPLVDGYLGEPGLISVHKTTLRKAAPSVPGAWHQDGTFMGPVRSLNLWLSLSRCGDVAPGLDIVPRRLEQLVAAGTDDAMIEIQTSTAKVMEAAGDTPILRPIFEPGDALFFDELFLHQTASDPAMPNPRYAIENWFFGASSFPEDYAPIAAW
jgi:hypothetical protein